MRSLSFIALIVLKWARFPDYHLHDCLNPFKVLPSPGYAFFPQSVSRNSRHTECSGRVKSDSA